MGTSHGHVHTLPTIDAPTVTLTPLIIRARDGYALRGVHFLPDSSPRAAILINAGTAIPQIYYAAFAAELASRGFAAITYDYRGVAASAPAVMRGFEATKIDWGRCDITGALDHLCQRHPEVPHFIFGHSVGGQLLGLVDAPERIDAVATYGTGFGYWGEISAPYKYYVWWMWYVGIPAITALCGYMPAALSGFGVDLPSGVVRDWARWGKRPSYFIPEIGDAPGFDNLTAPWRAFLATDDAVATPLNARRLHDCYRGTDIEEVRVDPADVGVQELGHVRFFSRKNRAAWEPVITWYEGQLAQRT